MFDLSPETFLQWTKVVAVIGGVLVGMFAVFSPSYVFLKMQIFRIGSGVLCGFGTVLILGSLYSNVSLSIGANTEIKFQALEKQLHDVQVTSAEAKEIASKLNSAIQNIDPARLATLEQLQKQVDQLSNKVTQLSATSEAALARFRSIERGSLIQQAPYRVEQPDKKLQFPYRGTKPTPEFGPAIER